MSIRETTRFRLTDQQISSDLAGEKVILNHQKGAYYGLNEVGALIWGELEKGSASFGALKEVVLAAYDVSTGELEADLSQLMQDLLSEKLVEALD